MLDPCWHVLNPWPQSHLYPRKIHPILLSSLWILTKWNPSLSWQNLVQHVCRSRVRTKPIQPILNERSHPRLVIVSEETHGLSVFLIMVFSTKSVRHLEFFVNFHQLNHPWTPVPAVLRPRLFRLRNAVVHGEPHRKPRILWPLETCNPGVTWPAANRPIRVFPKNMQVIWHELVYQYQIYQ